jgi:hypothetical protein
MNRKPGDLFERPRNAYEASGLKKKAVQTLVQTVFCGSEVYYRVLPPTL